ncbi:MAG: ABC transporter permease [Clostridiaceae bacterium]
MNMTIADKSKNVIRRYGTVIVALLVFIFFSVSATSFFTTKNVMLLLKQMSTLTIISLGFTFVMAVGGFDMSIGFATGLVGIIFVKVLMSTTNFFFALLAGLAVGIVIGIINGTLVSYIGLPDFIGTFAVGSVIYGIKMMMTEGNPIYVKGVEGLGIDVFKAINAKMVFNVIPVMVIIMFVFIAVCYVLMEKTKLGRRIYAIGGNREAAMFSGINVKRYKFITYLISAVMVSFTAILICSRLNSAQPTSGEGYLMDAISAVYLSTTMFGEGQPTILGTVVGSFIIAMLSNGLTMLGMTYYFQDITTGIVVILAVLMAVVLNKKAK